MTVWKSPVLYIGILLVIAVAGLVAAPFMIDWNSYRADLENYGRQLTGRAVTIEGDIEARLFPWPRLTAGNIRLANPPGLDNPTFATAERMVVKLKLAGLLSGKIDIESVEIDRPVVGFERMATGEGNWLFSPGGDLLKSDLLSRVSLDGIVIRDATLRFADRRRGDVQQLDQFNGVISAPGLEGPWRLRSVSLHRGRAYDIGVSTGIWRETEPFRFGVRVAPADGSGLVVGFDGAAREGRAEGTLRVEPAQAPDDKGDAEGRLRPLAFSAKVDADFDLLKLTDIEIGPRDPAQGGAITTGAAQIRLGRHITAVADLKSPTLDLDDLAGAGARTLLREAGSLAVAGQLLDILPADTSLAGAIRVTALKVGGATLDSVFLDIAADANVIRIAELSAGLPGRSRARFSGKLLPSDVGPQLTGSIAVESGDLRQLVTWAQPELNDVVAPYWTGSRGRLKLQTDMDATLNRFQLTNTEYEIDGERGTAALSISSGGRRAVDLRIDGNRIDLDSFVPGGLSALSEGGRDLGKLFALAMPKADAQDLQLQVKAGTLVLNGVEAKDVALDARSGAFGFELRTLKIGSVGGADLLADGLIMDGGTGAEGSIGLDVNAEDPRDLLRLLGMIRGETDPPWTAALGRTAMRGTVGVSPDGDALSVAVDMAGHTGEMALKGTGRISGKGDLSGKLTINTPTSGLLARLAGLEPAGPDALPGVLDIDAAGTLADGFMATLVVQAFGVGGGYNGVFDPSREGFGLDGKIAIRSTDVSPLVAALGLPVAAGPEGSLVFETPLVFSDGKYRLPQIQGRIGRSVLKGDAEADAAGKVNGHLETGSLSLQDVMAGVLLDWNGGTAGLESSFRAALPFNLTGQFWIKPATLAVHSHFDARDAEIGIEASEGVIRLVAFGKDATGRDTHIELASAGTDGLRKIEGRVSIPIDLQRQLLANGQPVAQGEGLIDVGFEAEGRSPGGALSVIRGSGSYDFDYFRLIGLTPSAFTAALGDARDAAGITAAFDALRNGEGLDFGAVKGTITMTNGEVAFQPVNSRTTDADVAIRTGAELALGEIDTAITVALKARPDLPVMTVAYAGRPDALSRSEDSAELGTLLGVTLMQQGVDELERLHEEQKRLAAQEELQRIEDEARLAAYYAQRDELLLRRRELKVHSEMRLLEAERIRQQIEAERAANLELNKTEVKQRLREVRLYRRLARAPAPKAEVAPEAVPRAKPRKTQAEAPRRKPAADEPIAPVILVQPENAPVIISEPSPSQ